MNYKYIREFENIIADITKNDTVQKMKNFNQHCDTTCFDHCKHVAYINYLICKKLKLDYVSAARAGMLHDLFLYNWRGSKKELDLKKYHAFIHPEIALENASKLFDLNKKEKDIIVKHMWPVTFFHFPKYRESFIITISDKYCAIAETFAYIRKKRLETKNLKLNVEN